MIVACEINCGLSFKPWSPMLILLRTTVRINGLSVSLWETLEQYSQISISQLLYSLYCACCPLNCFSIFLGENHLNSFDVYVWVWMIWINLLIYLVFYVDLGKEATLTNYIKVVFPLLLRNGVAHFLGYGNQHGFDPMSSDIQVIQLPNYLSCLAFNRLLHYQKFSLYAIFNY